MDELNELMMLRSDWTLEDYEAAYGDEWDEIPKTVKECRDTMRDYIHHTYQKSYIRQCIKDEK